MEITEDITYHKQGYDSYLYSQERRLQEHYKHCSFGLSTKTLKLLQMHNWEHRVGLHHRLVRQLHCPQLQGSRGWCCLHNASSGANYLPCMTPTSPNVTGRPKRSRTTTTWATASSPRYHPERGQYRCIRSCFSVSQIQLYLKAIRLINSHY